MARYRNVVFTLNNYTGPETDHICEVDPRIRYLVVGKEVGEQGTPHLQGYAEFKDKLSLSTVKTVLGSRIHIEPRRGKPTQAAGYCKKGSDNADDYAVFFPRTEHEPGTWDYVIEHGEISCSGKRTDLTPVVEALADGSTIASVARQFPEIYVRYTKGLRDLRQHYLPPRSLSSAPEVIVLWGETGTGKTRDAIIKHWPDEDHYIFRPSNGNWWDGYDGQTKVILEEFRGSMPWADLLGLLDRNEYRAPIKGGFVQIQADKFIITSLCPPDTWYRFDDRYDKIAQLHRRLTKVEHYQKCPSVLPGTSGQATFGQPTRPDQFA